MKTRKSYNCKVLSSLDLCLKLPPPSKPQTSVTSSIGGALGSIHIAVTGETVLWRRDLAVDLTVSCLFMETREEIFVTSMWPNGR